MKEEEILRIVEPIGKKLIGKKVGDWCDLSYRDKMNIDMYYSAIPPLNPVYADAIRHRNEVAVHAVKGTFPYELLRSKAPNQSDAEWNYQKGLVQSYTFPSWGRAENKTKIIGNEQNYSIIGWNEDQKKYFFSDYPGYHSLPAYFFDIVRKKKINFPNQVLLIRPKSIPYKETTEGMKVDQSVKIDYIVDIVDEFHKADYMESKYLVVICEETVTIEDRVLYQFDFYDDMNIYKIVPVGFKKAYFENNIQHPEEIIYEPRFILEHGWGYLPAQELKGEIQDSKYGYNLYHSLFSFAIPELNDAFRLSSNLSMSEYNGAFPTRVRVVDKCSYTDKNKSPCVDGKVWSNGEYSVCPSCQGTGMDSSISPTGEIQVKMYSSNGQISQLPMTPPMTYVAPPVDIYTHLDARIEKKLKRAFAWMFESDEADAGTATGKQLEKEEFYSSLVQFSNELFGLMHFSIEAIGFFMFGKEFQMPTVNNPKFFNFRDAADITAEIGEARKNNMPEPYILKLLKEYGSTRFTSDEQVDKFADFWVYCDRLWNKDDATIRLMVNTTCTVTEAIVHSSFTSFIEQAESTDDKFWDKTPEERKKRIFELAEEIAKALKPAPPQKALDVMTE